ncbi:MULTISPECIES: hypothetical protein [unclassified Providencia]|uniref:hypothetical protein n=1 Tax=unclassified Providencia TaxID=2633465 RepID=UPI00234B0B29|nr:MULTISPECIES: hypothetical protein [unclassified Providencia]MCL0002429.1 hypothetical protein [Providencia rettgeri]MCL0015442.1 hypothetical protein [Providencia rettgeri]
MFQPHVLVLKGPSNSGKTTTIKLVYHKIVTSVYHRLLADFKGEIKVTNYLSKKATSDIKLLVEIGDFKIAFESQGDPVAPTKKHHRLRDSLPFFVDEKCHIIICTSRTSGQTTKYVEACKPQYVITPFIKYVEPEEKMESKWEESAEDIFKKTLELYNSFLKINAKK